METHLLLAALLIYSCMIQGGTQKVPVAGAAPVSGALAELIGSGRDAGRRPPAHRQRIVPSSTPSPALGARGAWEPGLGASCDCRAYT